MILFQFKTVVLLYILYTECPFKEPYYWDIRRGKIQEDDLCSIIPYSIYKCKNELILKKPPLHVDFLETLKKCRLICSSNNFLVIEVLF